MPEQSMKSLRNLMNLSLVSQRTYERFIFNKRTQDEGESFDTFLADLRTLVKSWNYCVNCIPSMLRDRIVLGTRSNDTHTDLLKERKLTLEKYIDICHTSESAAAQNSALKQTETVHRIYHQEKSDETNRRPSRRTDIRTSETKACKFCGYRHIMKKEACTAWGKSCYSCQEKNHFASKCSNNKSTRKSKRVHNVVEVDNSDSDNGSEWANSVNQHDKEKNMYSRR
ncbi:Uncharacterised protein at_DN0322 [Pycnogonum litorale]